MVENILQETLAAELKFAGGGKTRAIRPAVPRNHPRALRIAHIGADGHHLRRNQRHEIHELVDGIGVWQAVAIVELERGPGVSRRRLADGDQPECQPGQPTDPGYGGGKMHAPYSHRSWFDFNPKTDRPIAAEKYKNPVNGAVRSRSNCGH